MIYSWVLHEFSSGWRQDNNVSYSMLSYIICPKITAFTVLCFCCLHPSISTIIAPNRVKVFWAQVLDVTVHSVMTCLNSPCSRSLAEHQMCFSANWMPLLFSRTTGDHCSFRKTPCTHSLQELHDDQCPKRQFGRELHDNHDRNTLFREKEYRRMLVLSGHLSLNFCC